MTNSLFIVLLILVSVSDIRYRKIPDKYIIMIGILGIVTIPFFLDISMTSRLYGALCVSMPLLLLNVLFPGNFGGGDIKLMLAGGWYLGCEKILAAFVTGILCAGVYCLGLLMLRGKGKRTEFALGPFLCIGMGIALFWGEYLISWFVN